MAAKAKRERRRGNRDRRLRARVGRYSKVAGGTVVAIGATWSGQSADARVVQWDFGSAGLPMNDLIDRSPYPYSYVMNLFRTARVDLNGDGWDDVAFRARRDGWPWQGTVSSAAVGADAGLTRLEFIKRRPHNRDPGKPSAIPAGSVIEASLASGTWEAPSGMWEAQGGLVFWTAQAGDGGGSVTSLKGNFLHARKTWPRGYGYYYRVSDRRGLMGIRFKFDETAPDFHYGWIELQGGSYDGFKVFGYAYETEPGVAIVPVPSSLSLLALGSVGVLARRRRKAERAKSEAVPATA